MKKSYFADTYALIEILEGNPDYEQFTDAHLITTKMNLAEFYYYLLRIYDEKTANDHLFLSRILTDITITSISLGMKLKFVRKNDRLSNIDCIGYAIALEQNIPFLTGDKQFKGMKNVMFVN